MGRRKRVRPAETEQQHDSSDSGSGADQDDPAPKAAPKAPSEAAPQAVEKHKHPDRCRGQIEDAFVTKMPRLPGELGILIQLPKSGNGPARINHKGCTKQQLIAVVEALNEGLERGPDKRLTAYTDSLREELASALDAERQQMLHGKRGKVVKSKQQRSQRQQRQHSSGTDDGADSDADAGNEAEAGSKGVSEQDEEELMAEARSEEGGGDDHEESGGSEEGQADKEAEEEDGEEDEDEEEKVYTAVCDYMLRLDDAAWKKVTVKSVTRKFAQRLGHDRSFIKPIVKRAADNVERAGGGDLSGQPAPPPPPRQRTSSRSPQAQPRTRPARAAKNGAAALLVQLRDDNSAAQRSHLAESALAQLAPEGAVQEAAVAASNATELAQVYKKLAADVAAGIVPFAQAQSEVRFADEAVAETESGAWHAQCVTKAIKDAKMACMRQSLQQTRK